MHMHTFLQFYCCKACHNHVWYQVILYKDQHDMLYSSMQYYEVQTHQDVALLTCAVWWHSTSNLTLLSSWLWHLISHSLKCFSSCLSSGLAVSSSNARLSLKLSLLRRHPEAWTKEQSTPVA